MAKATTPTPAAEQAKVQVFVPYRAGLPPLKPYFAAAWARRPLIEELARSTVRAENMDTWFGRVWNVLNPILLGLVYMMLVIILVRGGTVQYYLAYLLSGLFLFDVVSKASSAGAVSIVNNASLVTKTALPRIVLPLANIRIAVSRYVPMIVVLLIVSLGSGVRPHWAWLACVPLFVLMIIFLSGFVFLMATMQVYFRDTRNFLSYFLRIWLFLSPVLWTVDYTPAFMKSFVLLNPMYSIVGGFSNAFVYGQWPPMSYWVAASCWALGMITLGTYVFLSREREFAIRL